MERLSYYVIHDDLQKMRTVKSALPIFDSAGLGYLYNLLTFIFNPLGIWDLSTYLHVEVASKGRILDYTAVGYM